MDDYMCRGSFEYMPFRHPWEIRIIELEPGEAEDPIVCTVLHTVSSDAKELVSPYNEREHGKPIPYSALSYTWGDVKDKENQKTIWLSWRPFKVTLSLFSFLKQIRDHFRSGHARMMSFWIDALSINQKDLAERSVQVQRMRSIYEHATSVAIWLGPAADNSDLAMDLLYNIGECRYRTNGDLMEVREFLAVQKGVTIQGEQVAFDEDLLRALVHLFRRSWWTRAWIVQEATIPDRNRAHFLCGAKLCWFSGLCQAALTVVLLGTQDVNHCLDIEDFPPLILSSFQSSRQRSEGERLDLFTLLLQFRSYRATDAKDLIYALLGIAQDATSALLPEPDYNKSVMEVYRDYAQYFIETSSYGTKLDLLGYCNDYDLDLEGYTHFDMTRDTHSVAQLPRAVADTMTWLAEIDYAATEEEASQRLDPIMKALTGVMPIMQAFYGSICTSKNEGGIVSLTNKQRSLIKVLIDFMQNLAISDKEIPASEKRKLLEVGLYFQTVQADFLTWLATDDSYAFAFIDRAALIDIVVKLADVFERLIAEAQLTGLIMEDLQISTSDSEGNTRNWPSWVPDWRLSSIEASPLSKRDRNMPHMADGSMVPYQKLYSASGNHRAAIAQYIGDKPILSFNGNELQIYGFKIDSINDLKSIQVLGWTSNMNIHAELLSWTSSVVGARQHKKVSYALPDALNRTLVVDIDDSKIPKKRLPREVDLTNAIENLYQTTGRQLTVSTNGLLGLVPFSAKSGDEIYLLAGGQVFYVLRPSVEENGNFRLIGEAYIHGLMDGEALEWLQRGEVQLERVTIT